MGVSRRCLANSGYGSRTFPETTSSNAPKSSRSSNRSDMLLLVGVDDSSRKRSSEGRVGDGLHFGVLVEPAEPVLPSDTAVLVAAERCVGAVAHRAVDADESGAQPFTDGKGALERPGHHIAREPVRAV